MEYEKELIAALQNAKCINYEEYVKELLFKEKAEETSIIIYGAGNMGSEVAKLLMKFHIKIDCFFDRSAKQGQELFGIPVLRKENTEIKEKLKKDIVVIYCVLLKTQVLKDEWDSLSMLGYERIISGTWLIAANFNYSSEYKRRDKMFDDESRVLAAFAMLKDNESKDVYLSSIKAHANYKYEDSIFNEDYIQYFDANVPIRKKGLKFVDCGAFTGDTLQSLVKHCSCDSYVAFEPEEELYRKLSLTAESSSNIIPNIRLNNCAVSDFNGCVKFEEGCGTVSAINEYGSKIVKSVKLDDAVHFAPNFIKMDIEGAEISALHGAEKILKLHKPDLAICVYHRVSDLWEIPLLLHNIVPEYNFYLRCHSYATIETVLYGTINKG